MDDIREDVDENTHKEELQRRLDYEGENCVNEYLFFVVFLN